MSCPAGMGDHSSGSYQGGPLLWYEDERSPAQWLPQKKKAEIARSHCLKRTSNPNHNQNVLFPSLGTNSKFPTHQCSKMVKAYVLYYDLMCYVFKYELLTMNVSPLTCVA